LREEEREFGDRGLGGEIRKEERGGGIGRRVSLSSP